MGVTSISPGLPPTQPQHTDLLILSTEPRLNRHILIGWTQNFKFIFKVFLQTLIVNCRISNKKQIYIYFSLHYKKLVWKRFDLFLWFFSPVALCPNPLAPSVHYSTLLSKVTNEKWILNISNHFMNEKEPFLCSPLSDKSSLTGQSWMWPAPAVSAWLVMGEGRPTLASECPPLHYITLPPPHPCTVLTLNTCLGLSTITKWVLYWSCQTQSKGEI